MSSEDPPGNMQEIFPILPSSQNDANLTAIVRTIFLPLENNPEELLSAYKETMTEEFIKGLSVPVLYFFKRFLTRRGLVIENNIHVATSLCNLLPPSDIDVGRDSPLPISPAESPNIGNLSARSNASSMSLKLQEKEDVIQAQREQINELMTSIRTNINDQNEHFSPFQNKQFTQYNSGEMAPRVSFNNQNSSQSNMSYTSVGHIPKLKLC